MAQARGRAARYRADVTPFAGLADDTDLDAWHDLAALAGPDGVVAVVGPRPSPPGGWRLAMDLGGVQLDGSTVRGAPDGETVALGPADVAEMTDLVARTRPGPFLAHTVDLGGYRGIRSGGRLVAMAGERMHPPGWTEISAVCTDPAHRGQGLAARLIRAVAAGIRDRGELPFLHAATANPGALRLYRALGFTERRPTTFRSYRVPGEGTAPARS